MISEELVTIFRYETKGEGEQKKFVRGMNEAERAVENFGDALLRIGTAVSGAIAGLAIGERISEFVSSVTNAGRTFENFQTQLITAFEGSEAAAKSAFDWIEQFAAKSPEGINEITAAFVKLKAYGLDPTTGILESIGNAAAGMGKSTDQGVEAVADAVTGEFERLKEFAGIKAKQTNDAVTFTWNEGGKERTKTVKKNAAAIQGAFVEMTSRFNGAMDRQAKTFDGVVGKIGDRWQRFLRQVADAQYFDRLKQRLNEVADTLDRWASDGTSDAIAKGIGGALTKVMDIAHHLGTQAYRIGRGFYDAAAGVVELTSKITGLSGSMSAAGLGGALLMSSAVGRGILGAVAKRVPALATALLIDDVLSALNGDKSWIGSTEEGARAITNLQKAFADLKVSASGFGDVFASFREAVTKELKGSGIFDEAAFKSGSAEGFLGSLFKRGAGGIGLPAGVQSIYGEIGGMLGAEGDAMAERLKLAFTDPAQLIAIRMSDLLDKGTLVLSSINAVFEAVSGALDRLNTLLFGNAVTQAGLPAKPVSFTGQTTRAKDAPMNFDASGALTRDGMIQAEGLAAQFGGSPQSFADKAAMVAKLYLDVTNFLSPANMAKTALSDLATGVTARADLDITSFMSKIETAKEAARSLGRMSIGSGGGLTAPARIVTSAAQP